MNLVFLTFLANLIWPHTFGTVPFPADSGYHNITKRADILNDQHLLLAALGTRPVPRGTFPMRRQKQEDFGQPIDFDQSKIGKESVHPGPFNRQGQHQQQTIRRRN